MWMPGSSWGGFGYSVSSAAGVGDGAAMLRLSVTQARGVNPPGNPPGGGQVVEVLALTADQAVS